MWLARLTQSPCLGPPAHAKRSVFLSFFYHSHLGVLENNNRFRLCVNHSSLYRRQDETGFISALAILTISSLITSQWFIYSCCYLPFTAGWNSNGLFQCDSGLLITGSGEEPCWAIGTPRLPNHRTLFPISSVKLWNSSLRMASAVSAGA